ncbi:hypothetical protein E4634_10965 [Mangrovimicrobium sediminis]|uniref:Uncharacterized protein n=1 Tax=Mangrovimicrobium sediminis TaxID=2562682 RepID=A0A4Z0M232_9GAMM|nr:hypothetical protein [Haliea sp. SAOS-164]TGD73540.1 hypothetical protein E4634_10965 [Haliea sp. SAOS-164]
MSNDVLDACIEQVLDHPSFAEVTRESLLSCERFCDVLREARHEDILELQEALEEIALETDDHNEASGFLMMLITLGGAGEVATGGTPDCTSHADPMNTAAAAAKGEIPVADVEQFRAWAFTVPREQRSEAYLAALNALTRRVGKIEEDDYQARLAHHQINVLLHYILRDAREMLEFGNYAFDNVNSDFPMREQIPDQLWEAFNHRDASEVESLVAHWWGPGSVLPQDLPIALEWQRGGLISIHKGKKYLQAIAEYLLHYCTPGEDEDDIPPRPSHGIEAIALDPFLADELYEALATQGGYRWLISEETAQRVAYLNAMFEAGALNRDRIVAALDHGISKKWDKPLLPRYQALRAALD